MIRLSAFADEISPDLSEQIAALQQEGIRHLDLRSVDNVNVLELTDWQVGAIREALAEAGVRVAAIGSPIGKTPISAPFEKELSRLERALTLAEAFDAPYIRIFSFYGPRGAGSEVASHRAEVIERLRALTSRAAEAGVMLVHENEKDIYGDTAARCVDLLQAIDNPYLRFAYDPANFIQCGETAYPDAFNATAPWLEYVHVKDALADGSVVPAGEGKASWPATIEALQKRGYDGFCSLEPHLRQAGQFQGFSGPDMFHRASDAFQDLLRQAGIDYE